jgi:type I restriction enzyme M protein
MITGEIKSKVDRIWTTFWTGGISNPLTVIEQFSYLIFIKRLDDIHTAKERQANKFGHSTKDPIFTPEQNKLRWSHFRQFAPEKMFETVSTDVFKLIKELFGALQGTAV